MSACGSRFSSNRRIEPAVAVNDKVRPGRSSVCLVVESGGSLCCSATAGDAGVAVPCAAELPRSPVGADAAGPCCSGCGGSSAWAPTATLIIRSASNTRAARSAAIGMAIFSLSSYFCLLAPLPAFYRGHLGVLFNFRSSSKPFLTWQSDRDLCDVRHTRTGFRSSGSHRKKGRIGGPVGCPQNHPIVPSRQLWGHRTDATTLGAHFCASSTAHRVG